jgi:hypothetical protein
MLSALWGDLGLYQAIGLLVGSFLLTNCIVVWTHRKRAQRIQAKSAELLKNETSARTPITLITGTASGRAHCSPPRSHRQHCYREGFLGSGKTTLLNYILTDENHGLRIAVIENEVGSISIDHALLEQVGDSKAGGSVKMARALAVIVIHVRAGVFVMKNGCMCCSGESPGTELERILDKLISLMEFTTYDYGTGHTVFE